MAIINSNKKSNIQIITRKPLLLIEECDRREETSDMDLSLLRRCNTEGDITVVPFSSSEDCDGDEMGDSNKSSSSTGVLDKKELDACLNGRSILARKS